MFHNQKLSLSLSDLFPLPTVHLHDLPSTLQAALRSHLQLDPNQNPELRPSQATTPMGFTWSVDIGHFAARTIIARSLRILSIRRNSVPLSTHSNFLCKHNVPLTLAVDRPMICHIIDDITVITVDWPHQIVCAWHKILRNLFQAASLPISTNKSCPVNQVVTDEVPFIGLTISLATCMITPQHDKYDSLATRLQKQYFSKPTPVREWQQIVGKLCWYVSLVRPALAAFATLYKYPRPNKDSANLRTFPVSCQQQTELRNRLRKLTTLALSTAIQLLPICISSRALPPATHS